MKQIGDGARTTSRTLGLERPKKTLLQLKHVAEICQEMTLLRMILCFYHFFNVHFTSKFKPLHIARL